MNEPAQNLTVAAKPAKPIDSVRVALEKMKPQFQMALPKHITADRMLRVAMTAVQNTPKLLDCDRQSLFSAVMRAAQLGLEPDGILGQAYLIPFKRNYKDGNEWKSKMEVQFIPGYKGLIDLARRSGEVSNILAKEVYSNDEFTVDFSQEIPFTHKPKLDGDRGDLTHFWALARFKDGGFHWDFMTKAEVERIRDAGNGKNNDVWKNHFVEMGKKTMIRRIAKYLPMSVQKAATLDELQDAGKPVAINDYGDVVIEGEIIEGTVEDQAPEETTKKSGTDAIKDKLKKQDVGTVGKEAPAQADTQPPEGQVFTQSSTAATKPKQEPEPKTASQLQDHLDDIANAPTVAGVEHKFNQAAAVFKDDLDKVAVLMQAKADREKALKAATKPTEATGNTMFSRNKPDDKAA